MSEKNLYCSLAFNSISFGPHGGSRPCCAVDNNFWREGSHKLEQYKNNLPLWFNNKDIVNLRKDLLDNKWNPICNLCKIREEVGQTSTRQIFNNNFKKIEQDTNRSWKTNSPEIANFEDIFLLDITTGNKCNSACIMCNSASSSLWAKEQEEITGQSYNNPYLNWFSEEKIIPIVDQLPNLKAIQFAGGEPTIHEAVPALLRHLIQQGRSKDITLGFVTNLTGVSDEMLELWSHFSTKYIAVSIDGIDKVNEYIRYPFTWKKVTSQLEALKSVAKKDGNYLISLSHTITSLNLLTFGDMVKWWEMQVADEGSGISTSLPHIQCVNFPDHLDPKYVPKQLKDKTDSMLKDLEHYLMDNNLIDKYKPAIENIRNNVINNKVDEEIRLVKWVFLKRYIESLDNYRNRNIFDYIPYMKEFWNIEE